MTVADSLLEEVALPFTPKEHTWTILAFAPRQ
jgi:hypothetical protein